MRLALVELRDMNRITMEFTRIVLVVQCFAFGIELRKAYLEKHWRSLVLILIPVMTVGWLTSSLFIWLMFLKQLNWLDSLTCGACITATDPIIASSALKGRFGRRVPKHLRDLLTAESGCNDGMASPYVLLALNLVRYRSAAEVTKSWICVTILYECLFGALFGFVVGYCGRRGVRYAHENNFIDRECLLAFYFVLALFCAGAGSMLGLGDSLVGFSCGIGFSNDGWFQRESEGSQVSNVIDLLLNLTFFVYFGATIPWPQFNSGDIRAWRLVVAAILILLFRRIPIILMLKPIIPDIRTWREALFAGHFGPMGAGAIFAAIFVRADLETGGATPLVVVPDAALGAEKDNLVHMVWPITTFLVLTSIVVHGSTVSIVNVGRKINTLEITMSYTHSSEGRTNWMDRLPTVQSRSNSTKPLRAVGSQDLPSNETLAELHDGLLPRNFLKR